MAVTAVILGLIVIIVAGGAIIHQQNKEIERLGRRRKK